MADHPFRGATSMARYQFFSVLALRRQQYTYVDMASPLSSREGGAADARFEVEEDFIDAATSRGGGEVQIRLSTWRRDRQVRRGLRRQRPCWRWARRSWAARRAEQGGPPDDTPMARRQSALRCWRSISTSSSSPPGSWATGRGRLPHQHINVSAAVIVVIPLTVDTDVGIASRVLLEFHTHILMCHSPTSPLTVK
jgi:hypothetical protein